VHKIASFAAATLVALAVAGAAQASSSLFDVRYETEKPGMENTTATLSSGGTMNFDNLPTGTGETVKTDFGTNGAVTGTYNNLEVHKADQYGGAGGTGNYAVAFQNDPYTLNLSTKAGGGVNYFGFWLSALDPGNEVSFYNQGKLLFTFNPKDVINAINATGNSSQYYGNPNAKFKGQDSQEPFVFLDFFAMNGVKFDQIKFSEVGYGGGYESDNQTVGDWTSQGTGAQVKLTLSGGAPEPASWAMLIAGFGLIGGLMRRRRGPAMAFA
jgi:PEP-CTERM motif